MRTYFMAGAFLLLTLSSCVTILQTLVTPDNVVTDDRLAGEWSGQGLRNIVVQKIMNSKFKPTIEELDRHEYTREDSLFYTNIYVISLHENGLDYRWIAGIARINNEYYLNLTAQECLDHEQNESYQLKGQSFMGNSTIAKLEWKNNNAVSLHFFNGDRIKDIILRGNARIRHEYDPLFGSFVITASPVELAAFLEKYGNMEGLYKGGVTVDLLRKK
jgi:hypothetical protein